MKPINKKDFIWCVIDILREKHRPWRVTEWEEGQVNIAPEDQILLERKFLVDPNDAAGCARIIGERLEAFLDGVRHAEDTIRDSI